MRRAAVESTPRPGRFTMLLGSALDLKRDRQMQGHGLIDLFSALQAI